MTSGDDSMSDDARIATARDQDLGRFNDVDVVRVRAYAPLAIAMAGSFGSFIPGAIATAYVSLVWTLERHGDFSLSNGGGSLEDYFNELLGLSPEQRKKEEAEDALRDAVENAQDRARERERAWDEARHRLGGVTLTGAQWDGVLAALSDEATRAAIEDALTRQYEGDRARAKKATTDALELAQIAQRVKNGTATEADERRATEITTANPDAATALKVATENFEKQGLTPTGQIDSEQVARSSAWRATSAIERSSLIAARADLNAEPLTPIYSSAAQSGGASTAPATPPAPALGMNASLDMG